MTRPVELTIMLGIFLGARCLYFLAGLEFDIHMLEQGLQFVDVALLQDDLLNSILYLHSTPPVLNIIAGVGLKLFGESAGYFYLCLFHLLGFATLFTAWYLVHQLTGSSMLAWTAFVLIAVNPAFVLFENWFMYTFIACSLLTISAGLLLRYLHTRSSLILLIFFTVLALLVLTRAIFHLYWMIAVILVLLYCRWEHRQQNLAMALLPLLLAGGWYYKNLLIVDQFSSSSLLGLSINNVSTLSVPRQQLAPLVESGELSQFALISRYTELPQVLDEQAFAPETGVPVLDQGRKGNGNLNYNSLEMLVVSRLYLEDAVTVLKQFPEHYLVTLLSAHQLYFSPANLNYYFSENNKSAVSGIEKVTNVLLYGAAPEARSVEQPHFGYGEQRWFVNYNTGYLLIAFTLGIFLYGLWHAPRTVWKGNWTAENIVLGYIYGCLFMIYLAGTYLEFSENNRYRFIGEPLYWVMTTYLLRKLWKMRGQFSTAAPAS